MSRYNIYKNNANFIPFGVSILILIIILALSVFTKIMVELTLYNSPVVIDLERNLEEPARDRVIEFLKNDAIVNTSSIEYISKSNSQKQLSHSIDTSLFNQIDSLGIFTDLILFKFASSVKQNNLRDEFFQVLAELEGVSEINTASESVLDQPHWMKNIRILLWPLIILFVVILILIIRSLVFLNLKMNKETIRTISLVGQTRQSIFKMYMKSSLNVLFKSWMVAVLLFITVFYLFISRFNISFYDIGLIKLITVLILPLIIFSITIITISFIVIRKSLN